MLLSAYRITSHITRLGFWHLAHPIIKPRHFYCPPKESSRIDSCLSCFLSMLFWSLLCYSLFSALYLSLSHTHTLHLLTPWEEGLRTRSFYPPALCSVMPSVCKYMLTFFLPAYPLDKRELQSVEILPKYLGSWDASSDFLMSGSVYLGKTHDLTQPQLMPGRVREKTWAFSKVVSRLQEE